MLDHIGAEHRQLLQPRTRHEAAGRDGGERGRIVERRVGERRVSGRRTGSEGCAKSRDLPTQQPAAALGAHRDGVRVHEQTASHRNAT